MSALNVQQISVQYQQHTAVDKVGFALQQGEVGCLLGPSGCGKTSILRAIAGFEPITSGSITLGQQRLADPHKNLPPQQRKVGMVFQDFALYPHLTVWDNVAFGITNQSKQAQTERVASLLSLVGLETFKDQYPHQLSGGQQQRVALVRALAPSPELLLMDEPFSNLDITLRQSLAEELRQIVKAANITTILVTHDQTEAFAMADSIGVMHQGHLVQWGGAESLYQTPFSRFVAGFIGQGAFIPAALEQAGRVMTTLGSAEMGQHIEDGEKMVAHIRPEMLAIEANSDTRAVITKRLFQGGQVLYHLRLNDGTEVQCLAPSQQNYPVDSNVGIRLISNRLNCFGNA